MRCTTKDQFLVLLGHTAHDADDLVRTNLFAVLEDAEPTVNLVFRVFANATGVEENCVGFGLVGSEFVSLFAQRCHHELAIEHVHLTADRLDEKLAVVSRIGL